MSIISPFFTILTPVLDREKEIGEAIVSVDAQDIDDWEHVVVDNGSTDGTLGVLGKFQRSNRRVVHCPVRGVVQARNAGVRSARGKWVLFLDSDNQFASPDALRVLRDFIQGKIQSNVKGVFSLCKLSSGEVTAFWPKGVQEGVLLRLSDYLLVQGELAPCIDRSWYLQNPHPEEPGSYEGWLWYKMAKDVGVSVCSRTIEIYGTSAGNRICSSVLSPFRCGELAAFHSLMLRTYGMDFLKIAPARCVVHGVKSVLYYAATDWTNRRRIGPAWLCYFSIPIFIFPSLFWRRFVEMLRP